MIILWRRVETGGLKMSEDVYLRLREFLHSLPGGYPETESGVEIEILKKYFTPEEAEMATRLTLIPEAVPAIAARAGMEEAAAAELLESMASKGLIFRARFGDQVIYMANMFIVGIYEFNVQNLDAELAKLFERYQPDLGEFMRSVPTKQLRVVPINAAINAAPSVATYDRVRDLVKSQEVAALAPCVCRKEKGLLGEACDRPLEMCMTFGMAARYYIENGVGREITIDEALKVLDTAEESALVVMPMNSVDIMNICCCCKCCCGVLRIISAAKRPADEVQSSFQARIEPDLCVMCGTCLDRCQIEAVVDGEGSMAIDTARCIGCGLCVSTCPEGSITLVERVGVAEPPANLIEMRMRMAEERGLS